VPEEYETYPQETAETPTVPAPEPTSNGGTGLPSNLAGALCYLLGLITGIVFLLLEKDDRFVRFHAMQSIIVSISLVIASIILGFIPILGWALGFLLNLAAIALWVILMIKAYRGEEWEVPVLGRIAREQAAKTS